MNNVEFSVEKNQLVIRVDLTKSFGPSKSGKTVIVASTNGNAAVGQDGIKFGLNVFKKEPEPATATEKKGKGK